MTKPARTALCVLAALGLSYGVSPTISVTSPSGGQLFDADQPIKIAWNADAGFIPTKGTGLIRLYSAAGRLMLERVISKPDAYGNFTGSVDCDNLAGGMYLAVFSYGRYQANSAVMILR